MTMENAAMITAGKIHSPARIGPITPSPRANSAAPTPILSGTPTARLSKIVDASERRGDEAGGAAGGFDPPVITPGLSTIRRVTLSASDVELVELPSRI